MRILVNYSVFGANSCCEHADLGRIEDLSRFFEKLFVFIFFQTEIRQDTHGVISANII